MVSLHKQGAPSCTRKGNKARQRAVQPHPTPRVLEEAT